MESTKLCKDCGKERPISDFTVNRREKDGRDRKCRDCTRALSRAYSAENKERRAVYNRDYREQNREAVATQKKAWADAHPERVAEANRAYREEHREKLIEYTREWRRTHTAVRSEASREKSRAKIRTRYWSDDAFRAQQLASAKASAEKLTLEERAARQRQWQKANPEKVAAYRERTKEHRAEYGATYRATHREEAIQHQIQYRMRRFGGNPTAISNEFLSHLHHWQMMRCFYCGRPFGDHKHIEHVIPLVKGGLNLPHNVVLSDGSCNAQKHAHLYSIEWATKRYAEDLPFYNPSALKSLGKEFDTTPQDGFVSINGIQVTILSSFALSFGYPALSTGTVRAVHPDAALLWDYEWWDKREAVLNVLKAKCGLHRPIGARRLREPESLTTEEAKDFLDRWHIQGFRAGAGLHLGMHTREGDLLTVASFAEREDRIELARFASVGSIGGALSRLLKRFRGHYAPDLPLLTYVDPRFGAGGGYLKIGFVPDGETNHASYDYVNGEGIQHRLRFSRGEAQKRLSHYRPDLSEERNAEMHGFRRLHGLPQKRFVWLP